MRNLKTYFAERFPLAMAGPLSLATAALILGLYREIPLSAVGLLALSFLSFMLRMRVTDEFKDSAHDDRNYPNRPVQRGVISKKQLIVLGVIAGLIELSSVIGLGLIFDNPSGSIWYGLIVIYSVLTRFEFFAKNYLERHFNVYLITHQAIFLLYPLWINNLLRAQINQPLINGWMAFVLLMALMEIIRKYELRFDASGEVVMDTYLAVWKNTAFWIVLSLSSLAAAFLYLSQNQPIFALLGLLAVIALLVFRKSSETVRIVAAVFFILESALCLIL